MGVIVILLVFFFPLQFSSYLCDEKLWVDLVLDFILSPHFFLSTKREITAKSFIFFPSLFFPSIICWSKACIRIITRTNLWKLIKTSTGFKPFFFIRKGKQERPKKGYYFSILLKQIVKWSFMGPCQSDCPVKIKEI